MMPDSTEREHSEPGAGPGPRTGAQAVTVERPARHEGRAPYGATKALHCERRSRKTRAGRICDVVEWGS